MASVRCELDLKTASLPPLQGTQPGPVLGGSTFMGARRALFRAGGSFRTEEAPFNSRLEVCWARMADVVGSRCKSLSHL